MKFVAYALAVIVACLLVIADGLVPISGGRKRP
jgi:hypothetical protein